MNERNRSPEIKKHVIIELWSQTGKHSAGAPELGLIQQGLLTRFEAEESPASIARVLADHGVRLQHPEILEADLRWRQERMTDLFAQEEMNLETVAAATALVVKIERLRGEFEGDETRLEHLRQYVRQMKAELELLTGRELAREVAQWLIIWLQNPQIFQEWLELRRNTPEFRERFGE